MGIARDENRPLPTKWRVVGPKGVVRFRGQLVWFEDMKPGQDYHTSRRVTSDFGGKLVGVEPSVPALEADEHLEYC